MHTAADAMRISMLGPLEVADANGRPVRVGGHRVRALLILLALDAGRVIPSSWLIERIWPQERPADAANALQSLVSRLRQALRQAGVPDGVVESSPAGYRLALPRDSVDAITFEEQVRAGGQALARGDFGEAADLLRAALKRWRGSALADVAGEEFAFAPAARLTELQAAATLDRIEADLALGAADATMTGELRELTAADPLRERPAALLIRALAATGRQSEALAVYQRSRDDLAERLGVDPSPQLTQAYLAVLRQEIPESGSKPQPAGRAGPAVRCPPTSFVGRDDDVAGVLKRLSAERLVTLTGPGGVGKTRLAAETAARLTVPAWFAELAPVTDPAEVPYAILDALGLRERSIARRGADMAGDPVGRLCSALGDRDAMLLLDNCEHVIDAAANVAARLLSDCPRVKIIATSREPLQIPGETLYVVAPLPAPREHDVPEICTTYPAARLFADRAAAILPGFQLTSANAEVVASICRNLDGMPLAIELAAPWLRTLTPAQLATRLDDRFTLLTGGSRTALPRHQTLRAVVDWSWDLLSERERALTRRLAIFADGATLSAAERVCAGQLGLAGNPLPASAVLPTLAGLVGKSMLTRVAPEPGQGQDLEPRYRMLDTVRAYALERLAQAEAETGEDTQVRNAAARYYLELAEAADPQLRTSTQAHWFRVLAAEQDNVNAVIRWAIGRNDAETALRFVRALGYYWVQRGYGEADSHTREILAMTPPPLTKEIAEAWVICALLAAGWNWDIELIREPLTEALASLERFGEDHGSYHPLVAMAQPLLMQYDGETDQAQQQFEWYITGRDPWIRAIGKVYLSSYAVSLGRLDRAEENCLAGLAELRALGDQWGITVALTQLAELTELRADHAASIEAMTEAAEIGRGLGIWGDLTYVRARLAIIRARAGDLISAREEIAQVQRAVEARGGHVDTDRWVSFMLAELAALSGDYAEVARCCEAVLAGIAGNRARWWHSLRAMVKARLAVAVLRLGDRARSGRLLNEALDAAADWLEHPALAAVLDGCAVYVLDRAGEDDAERAARLLGAAHGVRGAFDESSLDAPAVRAAAGETLGPPAFGAAYESALTSTYESALTLGRQLVPAVE
ncbi:MAG TPA: BTAD domain-containing putative transcriptional regulator [Trebonia sp.]